VATARALRPAVRTPGGIDYALSFPGAIVHLDLSTDIRKPAPDIATSDAIARTVRYT